ncbi:hypothetical protein CH63R_11614 [Colletotrichum higginsianum IMI 349063]|uniref:Uncharacterized protein n=1 Tax=Colletotrichum higginsianum (strain IMI 349063) TaxID=759273 RepID=A0A1B7XYV7_COLHI|nr:hypothetical protein CH63R_11614 [Colletotrichum higginsianum IMI 349063]OBR04911.1 hypothetical protein CH63R_11614 [Colletotrichum higginsianum IMI 349063]
MLRNFAHTKTLLDTLRGIPPSSKVACPIIITPKGIASKTRSPKPVRTIGTEYRVLLDKRTTMFGSPWVASPRAFRREAHPPAPTQLGQLLENLRQQLAAIQQQLVQPQPARSRGLSPAVELTSLDLSSPIRYTAPIPQGNRDICYPVTPKDVKGAASCRIDSTPLLREMRHWTDDRK